MEKQKLTVTNVIKQTPLFKSGLVKRGGSVLLDGTEVVEGNPKFLPLSGSSELREKDIGKGPDTFEEYGKIKTERSLSGKQIASLLDLDKGKKKDSVQEKRKYRGRYSPNKKYYKAPCVAEVLNSKQLEIPVVTMASNVQRTGTMSSNIASGPAGLENSVKKMHCSSVGMNRGKKGTKSFITCNGDDKLNQIKIFSEDSSSSGDEFLKSLGAKQNAKTTAEDKDKNCIEAVAGDTLKEIKQNERRQGKSIRIIESPGDGEWGQSDELEPERKAKKLKTESEDIDASELGNLETGLSMSFAKSPERSLGEGAPSVKPIERKISDSQNELMELGFIKREHVDSQRELEPGVVVDETLPVDEKGDLQMEGSNSKEAPSSNYPVNTRHMDASKGLLKLGEAAQASDKPERQVPNHMKTSDIKLLQQIKTQAGGTSGVINRAILAKNIPPQYVMVIKPNVESLLKGRTTTGPDNKDSEIRLLDNAVKIVQRKELPQHRVISVPVGSEQLTETNAGKEVSTAPPQGMITVSRAGQATPITIPQPIQILSTVAGQMPRLTSPMPVISPPPMVPSIPKSADSSGHITSVATPSTAAHGMQVVNQIITSASGIQKARVMNVTSGTVSASRDGPAKLTYAQQFQAVQRALPGIVKVHSIAVMPKCETGSSKTQEMTSGHPVLSSANKPVVPVPISLTGQKLVRTRSIF